MSSPRTFFTRGGDELHGYLRAAGRQHPLILCSPRRRFVDELAARVGGRVFDRAQVHVPIEVLEAAEAELGDADTLIALGGGAAIGLGKALRVRHPHLGLIALPTTFSGSEMTTMYGTTTGTVKQTGRSPAAQPDAVFYNVDFVRDLPVPLAVQSLTNGIAHIISILSTGSLDATQRGDAEAAAATVLRAIEAVLADPSSLEAREQAQRGASLCGAAFEHGKPGVQHGLAHLLGGALRVEHAALHSILLPHFVAYLRGTQPSLITALERVLEPRLRDIYTSAIRAEHDLDSYLHDVLTRASAPVALTALGPTVTREAIDAALATRPELSSAGAEIVGDALHGLRPASALGTVDVGSEPHAVVLGCRPAQARAIILALHGRGAEAGTIARRYRDIVDDPAVSIVGLRAPHGAPRWYEVKYGEPGAGDNPEVVAAIARVESALTRLRELGKPLYLAGFSQGSCLALEVAARTVVPLAGVLAPAGARLGQPPWAPRSGLAMPVVVGAAAEDKWIARADLDATIAWYRAAGAVVEDLSSTGDKHEIAAAQRERIRALLR
jgi:maleylacetate reductase